jgi:flagellar biosynthesis chaperone FliJ
MKRVFPLDGLLRLRRMQEEEAAANVQLARARVAETHERERLTRAALGSEAVDTMASTSALHAIAAARASSRTMLSELSALTRERAEEAERAGAVHARTKADAGALEKLAERHAFLLSADDRKKEQIVLDELASRMRVGEGDSR